MVRFRKVGRVRGLSRMVLVLALIASVLAAPSAAAAEPSARQVGATQAVPAAAVNWIACRDGFQCANVKVPLDYDHPTGAKITLALIRLPASSPADRIGSLFVNPGGPGGSGVDFARGVAKYLPLEVRGRFDVVGFDPRGIARSTPLRCFDTFDEALSTLPPFPFPVSTAEEQEQRVSDGKLTAACARHGGAILHHMSTADVARDMDYLRALLGDKKLNFLGFSYGSMIGQTYANLFPNNVRALVVDGVLDPVAWTTGRGLEAFTQPFTYRIRSDQGAQATLGQFFALCDAAGPDCEFSGNSAARFAALTKQLKAHPIEFVDPVSQQTFLITYQDVIGQMLGVLFQTAAWPDAAFLLAALESIADPAVIGQRVEAVRRDLGVPRYQQEPYPNFVEGGAGVGCSDSINPKPFSAWPNTADKAEKQSPDFGRIWTWSLSACQSWPKTSPRGDDRYIGPWSKRTAKPVLVVGNYFDPSTRYQGAVTASRLLPNSRLLSYAGWGHIAFFVQANYCIDSTVTRYLVTTQVPPAGKVCQPEGSPFGPLEAVAGAAALQSAAFGPSLPQSVQRAFPQ